MGWTPLFLEMHQKNVLIVGAGEVGERRARRFLEAGANVVVLGSHGRGRFLVPIPRTSQAPSGTSL